MMSILLNSAAILVETILLVNYLRLRLVEVSLPEPCSSLVKHLRTYFMVTTNHSNVSDTFFNDQLTILFFSIKKT